MGQRACFYALLSCVLWTSAYNMHIVCFVPEKWFDTPRRIFLFLVFNTFLIQWQQFSWQRRFRLWCGETAACENRCQEENQACRQLRHPPCLITSPSPRDQQLLSGTAKDPSNTAAKNHDIRGRQASPVPAHYYIEAENLHSFINGKEK